jgi:DNA-binding NarL/FixJ family response regulator
VSISIAIVEDDRAVRASLLGMLKNAADCRCVGDFGSAEEALLELPSVQPNVVLMDINLPGLSGVRCVRLLSELLPKTQILMLTVQEDPDAIFNALTAGARGYLLKPIRAVELHVAVKDVFSGGTPMTSVIARKAAQSFKQAKRARSELEQLSEWEQNVLNSMASGYSHKETAERLGISSSTVHSHIGQIYQKLHVQSRDPAST